MSSAALASNCKSLAPVRKPQRHSAMITIEAIKFNHDSTRTICDALNVRRNASEFVPGPEWQRLRSTRPEDSCAAYALEPIDERRITIKVLLSSINRRLRSAQVRVPDCVKGRIVRFFEGATRFLTFELIDPPVMRGRVGIWNVEWQWEYRLSSSEAWRVFMTTRHRIYVVLAVPTAPWKQTPYAASNLQLPWTDALDYACRWAAGASTKDMAAGLITERLYSLGPTIVTYDCPGGGSSHYSQIGFDATAFLDRLRGGIGNGLYVNCSDCAAIVSTFANALGCNLWQSRMGWDFSLNEVLAIGSAEWQTACNWGRFNYHEVAWKRSCTAREPVYDACLQVDGSDDPTVPPHTPLLPRNLRFGRSGDLLYRDRLASPPGRDRCNPQPGTRQKRPVE